MKLLEFTKMHGAGNDFVVLDAVRTPLPDDLSKLAVRLCDRHFGVGADQVLVLRPSDLGDVRMDIYDADGSRVEMCGNGVRAIFKYLRDRGLFEAEELAVEADGRIVRPRWAGANLVRVDMGAPILAPADIPTRLGEGAGPVLRAPLEVEGRTYEVSSVSIGNPHAVLYVDDVDTAPVRSLGPKIENHPAFPARTNVEFVQVVARNRVRQRTWERGSGETLACGSGACAVLVASVLNDLVDRAISVELPGGTLEIAWPDADASVLMTGPAAEVFSGRFPLEEG